MFIPCPFLFAGIRTLISTFGNRTLSGRATSDETIRSCSPVSGIGCRCNFLSLLKFLSVGAMSQHATQIPYLTISEETVCPSPILPGMRHSAEPPHKTSSSQVSACRQKTFGQPTQKLIQHPVPTVCLVKQQYLPPVFHRHVGGKAASPLRITSPSIPKRCRSRL